MSDISLDRSELLLWKEHDISKYIIKEIKKRKLDIEKELTDGSLIVSSALDREYCRGIGELNGLQFFLDILESGEDSE